MLPVFSVILEYRMDGRTLLPSQQLDHSLSTECAFCTLAISKQTQTRSSLFILTIPVVAYNRARVQKSTGVKLIQGDRNNTFRGFKIHSQTKKLQYGSLHYLKIPFKSVLSPCTSCISCDKKRLLQSLTKITLSI